MLNWLAISSLHLSQRVGLSSDTHTQSCGADGTKATLPLQFKVTVRHGNASKMDTSVVTLFRTSRRHIIARSPCSNVTLQKRVLSIALVTD